MSMINKERLTEFANGLWAKIKQKVGEGIVRVTFEQATNELVVTKGDEQSTEERISLTALIGVDGGSYNDVTKAITLTKGDGTSVEIDLTDLVTIWSNLEFTSDIMFTNLMHGKTIETGHYTESGNLNTSDRFRSVKIPCTPGKTYRRTNQAQFQNTNCNLRGESDGSRFIKNISWVQTPLRIENRQIWEVTIPLDSNITHFTLSWNESVTPPQSTEIMVWDAAIDPPQAYVENTATAEGVLIHDKIKMEFSPFRTGLTSTTVDDAIREVALKVATGGKVQSVNGQAPDEHGNITLGADNFQDIYSKNEVDGKFVLKTDVANAANKIPRLNAQGKLERTVLPSIAINETFTFTRTTQEEAERAGMGHTVENGDMLILKIGTGSSIITKKYLCINHESTTFAERFIELTFPTDGITEGELQAALRGYVQQSETGTRANQVLRLDGQGKIDDNNLKLATSEEINAIINALQ